MAPVRAIGYARLNSIGMQPKNLDLNHQEELIREYVAKKGWTLVDIFREVTTSSSVRIQPKLDEIIAESGIGKFDALIVARLDRVTRNIRELDHFLTEVCQKNGVSLISIEEGLDTSTRAGRKAIELVDIIAKWDTKRISDRTREIIARKRAKGERVGHAPFGYTYRDKKLVGMDDEQKVIRIICDKREEGLSYHRIAKYLNEQQIASKRGGIWYAETVKTVYQSVQNKKKAAAI